MRDLGPRQLNVLLVEDNPGDVRLAQEALREAAFEGDLHIARDGVEAMEFLTREGKFVDAPRPDLVLLDLNLPRMTGREVLENIKAQKALQTIPVVILTTSEAEHDISSAYELHANCFVTKPVDLDQFLDVLQSLIDFWCRVAKLPPGGPNSSEQAA